MTPITQTSIRMQPIEQENTRLFYMNQIRCKHSISFNVKQFFPCLTSPQSKQVYFLNQNEVLYMYIIIYRFNLLIHYRVYRTSIIYNPCTTSFHCEPRKNTFRVLPSIFFSSLSSFSRKVNMLQRISLSTFNLTFFDFFRFSSYSYLL